MTSLVSVHGDGSAMALASVPEARADVNDSWQRVLALLEQVAPAIGPEFASALDDAILSLVVDVQREALSRVVLAAREVLVEDAKPGIQPFRPSTIFLPLK